MATISLFSAFLGPEIEAATLGTYAWAFGQGVLVDLTPCVYPLIPITVAVFGATGVSRGRALFLASAYVLGMASLYTTLGIVVALTGGQFGAWLGEPVVVLPIVGLLLALAASMFGGRLLAGAIHRSIHGGLGEQLIKGVAVAVTVLGAQVAINNMIYVPSGAWRQSPAELQGSRMAEKFVEVDSDKNGALSQGELVAFKAAHSGPRE